MGERVNTDHRTRLLACALTAIGMLAFLGLWVYAHAVAEAAALTLLIVSAAALMYTLGTGHGNTHARRDTIAAMESRLAEREQSLQQRVRELSILRDISLATATGIGVDQVVQNAIEAMHKTLPYTHLSIFLIDAPTGRLVIRSGYGAEFDDMASTELFVGKGLSGYVAMTGEALNVPDVALDDRYVKVIHSTRSELCVPMKIGERITGGINVESPQVNAFSDDDVRFLTTIAGQLAIVLENARLHDTLAEQATRDSLTQVHNHSYLLASLARAVQVATEQNTPLSFIMLDIDNFKAYNDTFGHATGDIVLKAIVQGITSNIKRTDTVGRWGGEEFGIVLPGANAAQAGRIADRIRETIAHLDLSNGHGQRIFNPTVSQGIACLPDHASRAEDLIDIADRALYQAKARGRDQVILASRPQE
jgi:diguanylate cyclase (GGDEF)-like protein